MDITVIPFFLIQFLCFFCSYLCLVASPPRKCRSFKFTSSTCFTFFHNSGSTSRNRSVTSLCTDGQKQNGIKETAAPSAFRRRRRFTCKTILFHFHSLKLLIFIFTTFSIALSFLFVKPFATH